MPTYIFTLRKLFSVLNHPNSWQSLLFMSCLTNAAFDLSLNTCFLRHPVIHPTAWLGEHEGVADIAGRAGRWNLELLGRRRKAETEMLWVWREKLLHGSHVVELSVERAPPVSSHIVCTEAFWWLLTCISLSSKHNSNVHNIAWMCFQTSWAPLFSLLFPCIMCLQFTEEQLFCHVCFLYSFPTLLKMYGLIYLNFRVPLSPSTGKTHCARWPERISK